MELIYSMRRKPLKCEPPNFESSIDPEVTRPICTISTCNIIAFSSPTELSDTEGDSWGGHVYVCDLDTPWDSHKVTSTIYPVTILEWDSEGQQLLVGTSVGDVTVFGQKDYLLNEWTTIYSATFPGEHLVKAAFFHNGRRVVSVEKKPDVPITDRIQLLRSTPTLKGFGGVAYEGACIVTASGLLGAIIAPSPQEPTKALTATECLRASREHLTCVSFAHKNGNLVIACVCECVGGRGCVRCYVCSATRGISPSPSPSLTVQPLPTIYLEEVPAPTSIAWALRDDTDTLLVAGSTLSLWKLTERSYPIHKLLFKGPLQGNTTPGGGQKPATDCFNTVGWQQTSVWPIETNEGMVQVTSCRLPLAPPYVVLATTHMLYLRARDNHHYACSAPVICGLSESAVPAGATPPKKLKYGPSQLPNGVATAVVSHVDTSWLGGVCVCVDSYAQLHLYKLPQPWTEIRILFVGRAPVVGTYEAAKHTVRTHYKIVFLALRIKPFDVSFFGSGLLALFLNDLSKEVTAKLNFLALFIPVESSNALPLAVQHVSTLAEFSLVSGIDCLDVLLTLKQNIIEALFERLTETFQRQSSSFQQYYYQSWLKIRTALCRISPSLQTSAAWLTSLQNLHSAWSATLASMRPDDRPELAPLAALLDEHSLEQDKSLLTLESKADLSNEGAVLGALRRPLQRAIDIAGTVLAAASSTTQHHSHGYELWCDPTALGLLRRVLLAARACGRGGEALSRPLARLAATAPGAPKPDLVEECAALSSQIPSARVWEALPRCAVTAPHGRPWPFYLEYGVEPETLRHVPEAPAYAQCETTPSLAMDSIRYMYLGGGCRPAAWRQCARCGARALPSPLPAKHPLQKAYDGRFLSTCRCGAKWTLFSNV